MSRTIKELSKEAIEIQYACNLSGVVHSFSRVMTELRTHVKDTESINKHPIAILFSSKISSLTGSDTGMEFNDAYEWCMISSMKTRNGSTVSVKE